MTGSTPHIQTLASAVTIAGQLAKILREGREPTVWTPPFPFACWLTVTAVETHRAAQPLIEALARGLAQAEGAEVVRSLELTSSVVRKLLWFWKGSGRQLPQSFPGIELLHIAFAATALPTREAVRRVMGYAVTADAFSVVHQEYYRRGLLLGPKKTAPGVAVVQLVTGEMREAHPEAFKTLERFARVEALATSLPENLRGSWDFDDVRNEIHAMLVPLINRLKEKPQDELLGMLLDGDPQVTHLPHAAEMDVRNRFESLGREPELMKMPRPTTYQDENSDAAGSDEESAATEIAEHFGKDGEPALPSEVRRSPQEFTPPVTAGVDLRRWVADPPQSLLEELTPTDRKILEEYRKSIVGETRPLESGRDLATRAGCSPAAVVVFLNKVRENSQGG